MDFSWRILTFWMSKDEGGSDTMGELEGGSDIVGELKECRWHVVSLGHVLQYLTTTRRTALHRNHTSTTPHCSAVHCTALHCTMYHAVSHHTAPLCITYQAAKLQSAGEAPQG